ncbi:TIR domain-containing protein [Marinomonas profundimaris]|uniref:Molecular chaperone Tir n=1 Tax=Marinomonas profundimaris TaxID=1208321 RepID=W1RXG8_9GAMM|nr:TIR domain-containing protein [Marinomonas profundimaris]ETI60374.1 molecular chaperone Tir [Marinomonas profundimaris]
MTHKYDLAISFAGEDRAIAKEIANQIKKMGYSVFYDEFEKAHLLGKNLIEEFLDIYMNQSSYFVPLISLSYKDKVWTKHEFRAALSRSLEQEGEYILPFRLDNTQLPGLNPHIGYLSITDTPINEFIEILSSKLAQGIGKILKDTGISALLIKVYTNTLFDSNYVSSGTDMISLDKSNALLNELNSRIHLMSNSFAPKDIILLKRFMDDIFHIQQTNRFRDITRHPEFRTWLFLGGSYPANKAKSCESFLKKCFVLPPDGFNNVNFDIDKIEHLWNEQESKCPNVETIPSTEISCPETGVFFYDTSTISEFCTVSDVFKEGTHARIFWELT